jgi:hypothetical protein
MRTLLTLSLALTLSACGVVELPDTPEDRAVYYVSTNAYPGPDRYVADVVAIAYMTPDGMAFDTLALPVDSPPTTLSWSQSFPRETLDSFTLTATNLSTPAADDTTGDIGFVGAVLMIGQEIVAEDSSRTEVTLTQ